MRQKITVKHCVQSAHQFKIYVKVSCTKPDAILMAPQYRRRIWSLTGYINGVYKTAILYVVSAM